MPSSPPGFPFEFSDPLPQGSGAEAGVIVIMIFQGLYYLGLVTLAYTRRHTRIMQARSHGTLARTHLFGLLMSLNILGSFLTGKPPYCEALGYFYTMFLPLIILPFALTVPEAIFEAEINTRKVAKHLGKDEGSIVWKIKALWTPYVKLLFQVVAAAVQLAVYIPVRYLTSLPGDCVRSSLVVTTAFSFVYMLAMAGFFKPLSGLKDPLYLKPELHLGFLVMTPFSLIMFVYAISPESFPESFDFRIIPAMVPFVAVTNAYLFPIIMSFEAAQRFFRRSPFARSEAPFSRLSVSASDDAVDLEGGGEDTALLTVLRNPVLLEGFTKFCEQQWSVENILFWKSTEDFGANFTGDEKDQERARLTVEEFVINGAPLQVNLDDPLRRKVTQQYLAKSLSPEMFEEARQATFSLMERDSYRRWTQTWTFQETLKAADQERKQGKDPNHDIVIDGLGARSQGEDGAPAAAVIEELV